MYCENCILQYSSEDGNKNLTTTNINRVSSSPLSLVQSLLFSTSWSFEHLIFLAQDERILPFRLLVRYALLTKIFGQQMASSANIPFKIDNVMTSCLQLCNFLTVPLETVRALISHVHTYCTQCVRHGCVIWRSSGTHEPNIVQHIKWPPFCPVFSQLTLLGRETIAI